MKSLIKFSSLILLFWILVRQTRMYADFTASNSNIIILPSLAFLIFLNIILIYIHDAKKKIKFTRTNIIVFILIILFGVNLLLNYKQSTKEIELKLYVSNNFMLKQRGYEIKLYRDRTLELNEYWHGESRHYFGKYLLENDQLTFNDENIEEKTDYQITNRYRLDIRTQNFISLEKGFQNLNRR